MRSRIAFIITAVLAVLVFLIPPTSQAATYRHPHHRHSMGEPMKTVQLDNQALAPIGAYASAVVKFQLTSYAQAIQAKQAQEAAQAAPPQPVASPGPQSNASIWACIRSHESGGNYSEDTGNGYYGAYQFLESTWQTASNEAGYPGYTVASDAPPAVQDAVAVYWQSVAGWSQWSTAAGCGA